MKRAEKTFKKAFDAYHEPVFHFALRRTKNKQDAEDITQAVFLKLWQRQDILQEEQLGERLLFTIAKNTIIDYYRQRFALTELVEEYLSEAESSEEKKEQLLEKLHRSIASLPPGRRKVLRLSRFEGMTYKEIAQELNISSRTVENQVRQALITLRQQLTALLFTLFF